MNTKPLVYWSMQRQMQAKKLKLTLSLWAGMYLFSHTCPLVCEYELFRPAPPFPCIVGPPRPALSEYPLTPLLTFQLSLQFYVLPDQQFPH